ncbi:MAG TPA: hypothetical protein VF748_17420 [Candidatus Acidoferrum sp.]
MSEVRQLFTDAQPGPAAEEVTRDFVEVARKIASICATRILLLIAVLAGVGVWGLTVWEPTVPRLEAAVAYSAAFVLPLVALYWRRA